MSSKIVVGSKSPIVVIPALNEAVSLPRVLVELQALKYDVVVIDDGSTDNTFEIAVAHGVEVLRLAVNLGVGGALRAGFRYAIEHGYSTVVQVDADGQHPVHQISNLLRFATDSDSHLVIGSRYRSSEATLRPTVIRRLPMRMMSAIISLASGVTITDATSGFRVIREPLLSEFAREFPTYYLGDTYEATLSAARAGYRIAEVPAALRTREHGESSTSALRSVALVFKVLATTILRLHPRLKPLHQ